MNCPSGDCSSAGYGELSAFSFTKWMGWLESLHDQVVCEQVLTEGAALPTAGTSTVNSTPKTKLLVLGKVNTSVGRKQITLINGIIIQSIFLI